MPNQRVLLSYTEFTDVSYCCPQDSLVNITECDLQVSIGPFSNGPGRLATQLLSPLPGFTFINRSQPFLRLSTRISSAKVFLVDDMVVVFGEIPVSPWQCMLYHVMCTCPKTPLEHYPLSSSDMRY